MPQQQHIMYSDKYYDENYEYRHVQVPPEMVKTLPKKLMTEEEWRAFGIQQSHGWVHYMIHEPEPHIILFRRPIKGTAPTQEEQFKMEEQIEAEAEAEAEAEELK